MTGLGSAIDPATMNVHPGIPVGLPLLVVEVVDRLRDGDPIRVPFLLHILDQGLPRPLVNAPVLETNCQTSIGMVQYTLILECNFLNAVLRLPTSAHLTCSQLLRRWLTKNSNHSKWAYLGPQGWSDSVLLCSSHLILSSKSTLLVHRSDLWAEHTPKRLSGSRPHPSPTS